MRALDLMDSLVTVPSDATVGEVAGLLLQQDLAAVIVTDERGEPAGILSERDLARAAQRDTEDPDEVARLPAGMLMRPLSATVTAQTDADAALEQMGRLEVNNMPVIDAGRIVGILCRHTMRRKAASALASPATNMV